MTFPTISIVHLLITSITISIAYGNDNANNIPAGQLFADKLCPLDHVNKFTTPAYNASVVHHDYSLHEKGEGLVSFATVHRVPDSFFSSKEAMWELLEDGTKVWRSLVEAPPNYNGPRACKSFNFAFKSFQMPRGGSLHIYDPDTEVSIGPFTHAHNTADGELWTPILSKCRAILEVNLAPGASQTDLFLRLGSVNEGYRYFGPSNDMYTLHDQNTNLNHNLTHGAFRDLAAECNINVECESDWVREGRSVAAFSLGGHLFCTGFMINNVEQDYKPYFMTAAHCQITKDNAKSLVVYWNWKYDSCDGGHLPENSLTTTGATFLASYKPSDSLLVELHERPDPRWGVTFAGWDRTGEDVSSYVGIHYPLIDDGLKMSFGYAATTTTSYGSRYTPGDGNYFRLPGWDRGLTQPGSSGSPLFNSQHQVIGTLRGGRSKCDDYQPDWYGKFSATMDYGGFGTWLDPKNTKTKTVDTIEYTPSCGNSIRDLLEVCDGNDFGGETCANFGFSGGGFLTCNNNCGSISTKECIGGCGNGITEDNEFCDGIDTGSVSCTDMGYSSGTLKCNQNCTTYDTSQCTLVVQGPDHLSGEQGDETLFCKDVSVELPLLKFYISGGTGNADLYAKKGSIPTTSQYDCRSQTSETFEECVFAPATPGRYCVMVHGHSSYTTTCTAEASRALVKNCSVDSQCDDGIDCTEDFCDWGTGSCVHTPIDSVCDDGIFCNGEETCQSLLGCQDGAPPCDDNIACTDDTCEEISETCQNHPNNVYCDDGIFCNGYETCHESAGCQTGTDPCPDSGSFCNERSDTCVDTSKCTVMENFDNEKKGDDLWGKKGSSCKRGKFVIGTPTKMTSSGVITQIGGDHTSGKGFALYSAPNTDAESDDIDDGTCIATSPSYRIEKESVLSLWYFFGQRDAGDDGDDGFSLEVLVEEDGKSERIEILETFGDVTVNATWTEVSTTVPAHSDVRIRIQATDAKGNDDFIEAGVDDLSICALD